MKNRYILNGLITTVLLVNLYGCDRHNPLLTDENLSRLRSNYGDYAFTNGDPHHCAAYCALRTGGKFKLTCETWSITYYRTLQRDGVIAASVTLEEFRDPLLWQRIIAK